jgi:CRISPR-associated endonuclease/helicase Cas3
LAEHLNNVAQLARELAERAAPEWKHFHDLAAWSGLLHDYGKYTACFQEMIRRGSGKCPHAIFGASMAWDLGAPHVAAAVAGHHAGMPDFGELRIKAPERFDEAKGLLVDAASDLPELAELLRGPRPGMESVGAKFDLMSRMLLSCLVDADRLDTAHRASVQAPLDAERRLRILLEYISGIAEGSPEGVVKSSRQEVLRDCLDAASHSSPILSLSVPTGGGKTLSSMALALKRAALQPDRYRRIIVVIPYLSIIEQNAEVYAKVFGADAILEHHSGSFARLAAGKDDKHFSLAHDADVTNESTRYLPPGFRPETENWDAPLVVTTSVRFFESLFSNHPSDLRRVHNIAGSIVILDEVQVLPRALLAPLLEMIDELGRDWRCSFVLSTATKPAFEKPSLAGGKDRRWPGGTVYEVIRKPDELHRRLRRVSIDWRISEPVGWPEVADWL